MRAHRAYMKISARRPKGLGPFNVSIERLRDRDEMGQGS